MTLFFPRGDCQGGVLEVELYDRKRETWAPHPRHPRILGDRCHEEDAGGLLNEIRVRCVDPDHPQRVSRWIVGARVFVRGPAPECIPAPPRILLTAPVPGEAVRDASKLARLAGRVVLDPSGSEGLETLRIENRSNGAPAIEVKFTREGRFSARLGLETGLNRVGISARLVDGREAEAEFPIEFDPSLLREQLLQAERERIERIRARRGEVEVEAEDRKGRAR